MNITKQNISNVFVDYEKAEELAFFLLSTKTLIEHNNEQVTDLQQLKWIIIERERALLEAGLPSILERKTTHIPNRRIPIEQDEETQQGDGHS